MFCSELDIEEIEEINIQAHGSLQEEVEVSPVEKCFQNLEEEDAQFHSAVSCFQIIRMLPPTDVLHTLIHDCDYKGKVKELPKVYPEFSTYELEGGKGMEGMEQKYEGNIWTKPQTQTRANKTFVLRKSFCGGTFQCMNENCSFRTRTNQPNKLHWNGQLIKSPKDGNLAIGSFGNLECFFCKHVPMCLKECPACVYYFMPKESMHSRLFIHYGKHTHTVSKGMCRASIQNIKTLVARAVRIDHNAGPRKVQMVVAREVVLRAFTDDDKAQGEFMTERELQEMSQELQNLINVKK